MENNLDVIDKEILAERVAARERIQRPRVGDYVRFPTGELERFSHDWGDRLQTSPSGSIYLGKNGQGNFSGGLNPAIPLDQIALTDVTLHGSFWFFHHDRPGAHCGVAFEIPCRVYSTKSQYQGFLGHEFRSLEMEAKRKELENV